MSQQEVSRNVGSEVGKTQEPSVSGIFSGSPLLIFARRQEAAVLKEYWIHQWLPSNTFYAAGVFLSIGVVLWLIGLGLSGDYRAYVLSHEWQVQPLYLAGHLFTAWMFVLPFTRLFHRALGAMEGDKTSLEQWTKAVLSPAGIFGATILATPFWAMMIRSFLKGDYDEYFLDAESGMKIIDIWMLLLWATEWWISGYIWFILLGFVGLTIGAISILRFTGEIEDVLIRETYRPFLLLVVQGASCCLFFCLINSAYVWYAEGETDDYVGLGLTIGLLLAGFAPPWIMLRQKLERDINDRHKSLGSRLLALELHETRDVAVRDSHAIQEFAIIARIQYLDRLKAELGQKEGRSVVLRLLIPAATMAWEFLKPFFMGG